MTPGSSRIAVFCDFNGTITSVDTLQTLLRLQGCDDVLAATAAGSVRTLRERIAAQAAAVRCTLDEAVELLAGTASFDDTFAAFRDACRARGHELTIVSSGIDALIRRLLELHGCGDVPVIANDAEFGSNGWHVRFRDDSDEGNAKAPYVLRAAERGLTSVMIGDDESDFAAATVAQVRFAKRDSVLAAFLSDRGLEHSVFATFAEIPIP